MRVTLDQAAMALSAPRGRIQKLCREGRVWGARKVGGKWMIELRTCHWDLLGTKRPHVCVEPPVDGPWDITDNHGNQKW